MSSAERFLALLERKGLHVRIREGERLGVGPPELITPADRKAIGTHAGKLAEILGRRKDEAVTDHLAGLDPEGPAARFIELELVSVAGFGIQAFAPGEWDAFAARLAAWNAVADEVSARLAKKQPAKHARNHPEDANQELLR